MCGIFCFRFLFFFGQKKFEVKNFIEKPFYDFVKNFELPLS